MALSVKQRGSFCTTPFASAGSNHRFIKQTRRALELELSQARTQNFSHARHSHLRSPGRRVHFSRYISARPLYSLPSEWLSLVYHLRERVRSNDSVFCCLRVGRNLARCASWGRRVKGMGRGRKSAPCDKLLVMDSRLAVGSSHYRHRDCLLSLALI